MKNPQSLHNPQSTKSDHSEDLNSRPKKTRLEQIEGIKLFSPRNDSLRKVQSVVQHNDLNPNFINEPEVKKFIDHIIKKYEFDDNLEELQSDSIFISKIRKQSHNQLMVIITTLFKCLKAKTQDYDKLFKCLLRKFSISQDQDLHQLIEQVNDQINERTHIIFAFSMPLLCEVKDEKGNIVKKELPRIQYQKEYQNIIKGISGVEQNLRIRMVCATSNSIKRILSENPIALHFAGHGAKNCPENFPLELYPNLRGKGDFLILEQDEDGSPSYLCESDLRDIFEQLKQQIQFVFVASCHSEMIGIIFRKAGAQHVICVRENEPIMDDAILYFSENFYNILFRYNKTICGAFWEVKEMMMKKYPSEAWKILIIRDCDEYQHASDQSKFYEDQLKNNKVCNCCQLGPFDKGQMIDLNKLEGKAFETQKFNTSNKFLIGRSVEISDIIIRLNQLKMLTVIGPIGIGKTLIAQNVCHYLQERNKFKDGIIQISIKSYDFAGMVIPNLYKCIQINIPDLLRKVKEDTLINKNSFGKSLKNNQDDHHIDKIQDKLSLINRCLRDMDVLIWLDNMLDDIHNDTEVIQEILDNILENCPQVKVLYTSRQPLTQNTQNNELDSIYRITKLSNCNAVELFLKKAQLKIEFEEDRKKIIEFLNHSLDMDIMKSLSKDSTKFSNINMCTFLMQKLESNPLFDKLNGNPTVIILNASKMQQNYDLIRIDQLLRSETFEILQPLTASMETSYQWIKDHNLDQAQLLCLVGLMPKGIQLDELKRIWPLDKAFDILNSLIDFSLIELVTIKVPDLPKIRDKAPSPIYLYKVILPFMNNFIELKSQELFPENDLQNKIISFFIKEMVEIYDKIDVEEHLDLQDQFKEWLNLHQQNIWAALLRIQGIQGDEQNERSKEKSESTNQSIGSVNSLNLESDSDEKSPPLKDTKKRLLIRTRSSSVVLKRVPLIVRNGSEKEQKPVLKVAPLPVLDGLVQQPVAVPPQNPKRSPKDVNQKDVQSIQNKQQYLQVQNKLKNIFNKPKKVDDQSSNQSFSERLINSSINKSFNQRSKGTPLKRFSTIRSSRDHLKLMSKYEQEVSSTYKNFNASRKDQRDTTSKLAFSKQSSGNTSINKVIPSQKFHSDISSDINNRIQFGLKNKKRMSKKHSEETKSSLAKQNTNEDSKRESIRNKLNLTCLPEDAQLLLYYTSCLIINKQNELAIQSLRLFEKIQIQSGSPDLTTIVQLNVKKLLSIAQFNMNINLNEAEEFLNYSKNEFQRLRVLHGVAICALAKAYFLFTKYELLVSENYDRSIELILADSHNECQIAYQNFASINSEMGMQFCLNLEDELMQKKETLEPSIFKDSFKLSMDKPKKLENKQDSGSFRYRERQQGKAISLLIEFSINQVLEDEVLNLEKYWNGKDQGLNPTLKREKSNNWISHQRLGEENVHYKGQEEESKYKNIPTNKFLRHKLEGQIQNQAQQQIADLQKKKPQKPQNQLQGPSKEQFKKQFAKHTQTSLLKNEYDIKKLQKQESKERKLKFTEEDILQRQRFKSFQRADDFFLVSITLEALEVNLPRPQNRNKNKQLSIVIKRGQQQRFETKRFEYFPLEQDQHLSNMNKYLNIAQKFDQAYGINPAHKFGIIEGRDATHRIYELSEVIQERTFMRNQRFQYANSHKFQNNYRYKAKMCEIKIEGFDCQSASSHRDSRQRKGFKKLNLADYIDKGQKIQTFKMNDEGSIFLTVKISVMQQQEYQDIKQQTAIPSNVNSCRAAISDDSDEKEASGQLFKAKKIANSVQVDDIPNHSSGIDDAESDEDRHAQLGQKKSMNKSKKALAQMELDQEECDLLEIDQAINTSEQKQSKFFEIENNQEQDNLEELSEQEECDLLEMEQAQQLPLKPESQHKLSMKDQNINMGFSKELSLELDQEFPMRQMSKEETFLEQMQELNQANLSYMGEDKQSNFSKSSFTSFQSQQTPLLNSLLDKHSQQLQKMNSMLTQQPKQITQKPQNQKFTINRQKTNTQVQLQVSGLSDDESQPLEEYNFKSTYQRQKKKQVSSVLATYKDKANFDVFYFPYSQKESVKVTENKSINNNNNNWQKDKKSTNKLKIGQNNKFITAKKKKQEMGVEEKKNDPSNFIKISNLEDDDKKFVATYHLLPSVQFQQNLEDPISEQDVESSASEIEDHPIDEMQNEMNQELEPVSNYQEVPFIPIPQNEEQMGDSDLQNQLGQEQAKSMRIKCNKNHLLEYEDQVPEYFMKQYKKDLLNLIITCDSCKKEIPHNASRLQCRQCDLDYCVDCMYEDKNSLSKLKRTASLDQKDLKLTDAFELNNNSLNKSGGSRKSAISQVESPGQRSIFQSLFNKIIPKKKSQNLKQSTDCAPTRESIFKEKKVTKIRARAKSFNQDVNELDSPLIDEKPLIEDTYAEELYRQHQSYADVSIKDIDLINAMVVIIKKKIKIEICPDTDITKETSTCIVNSAGPHLANYSGGLPGQIVRYGGHVIQRECQWWIKQNGTLKRGECAYTGAGALPSKYIIHAIGPDWCRDNQKQSIRELNRCVKNVLNLACSEQIGPDIESISIPPISTGYKNGPIELCTKYILETCIKYCLRKNTGKLNLIRLCCVDPEAANYFQVSLLNYLANEKMK